MPDQQFPIGRRIDLPGHFADVEQDEDDLDDADRDQLAEEFVTPLTDAEVDALAELVRRRTGLAVEGYYGAS